MPPWKPTKYSAKLPKPDSRKFDPYEKEKEAPKRATAKKPPLPRELYPAATPPELLKEKAAAQVNLSPAARKELSKTPLHWYAGDMVLPDMPGATGVYNGREKGMEVAGGKYPESTLNHEFAHGWYDRNQPDEDEQARFMRNMQGLSGYEPGVEMASNVWRRDKPFYENMWGGSVPLDAEANELQARIVQYGAGSQLPEYYREKYWPGLYNPPTPEQARYIEQERMDYPIPRPANYSPGRQSLPIQPWYKRPYAQQPFRYDPLESAPLYIPAQG